MERTKRSIFTVLLAFVTLLLLQTNPVSASRVIEECPESESYTPIREDTILDFDEPCEAPDEGGPYDDPGVLTIKSDDITVDCDGNKLVGDFPGYPEVFELGIFNPGNENVTIKNCILKNYGDGILLLNSKNNKIVNNTFINNQNAGLVIDNTSKTTAKENEFRSDSRGILFLPFSNENLVKNNYISPREVGMEIEGSYDNKIYNNTIEEPERRDWKMKGLWMRVSPGENEIHNNKFLGDADVFYGEYAEKDSYPVYFSDVEPSPQSLSIFKDGSKVLKKPVTPPDVLYLPKGNYTFVFEAEGYEKENKTIELDGPTDISTVKDSVEAVEVEEREDGSNNLILYLLIGGTALILAVAYRKNNFS